MNTKTATTSKMDLPFTPLIPPQPPAIGVCTWNEGGNWFLTRTCLTCVTSSQVVNSKGAARVPGPTILAIKWGGQRLIDKHWCHMGTTRDPSPSRPNELFVDRKLTSQTRGFPWSFCLRSSYDAGNGWARMVSDVESSSSNAGLAPHSLMLPAS